MSVEWVIAPNQNKMENHGDLEPIAKNMKPIFVVPKVKAIFFTSSNRNIFVSPGYQSSTMPGIYPLIFCILGKKLAYTFSHSTISGTIYCSTSSICSLPIISQPPACPSGYKETRTERTCSNCSHPLGKTLRCRCTNWMTCAHRWSSSIFCPRDRPFLHFIARECVQGMFIRHV